MHRDVIRKHHCLITDKASFLKICIYHSVSCCGAVRPKLCRSKLAESWSEVIYIHSCAGASLQSARALAFSIPVFHICNVKRIQYQLFFFAEIFLPSTLKILSQSSKSKFIL